jgi:hypothetical protein
MTSLAELPRGFAQHLSVPRAPVSPRTTATRCTVFQGLSSPRRSGGPEPHCTRRERARGRWHGRSWRPIRAPSSFRCLPRASQGPNPLESAEATLIGKDPGGASGWQRSLNSTIMANMTNQKSGRLPTPRSCGLQGVTPSVCPYELRFLGRSPILSWRFSPSGQVPVHPSGWLAKTHTVSGAGSPQMSLVALRAILCQGRCSLVALGLRGHTSRPFAFALGQPSWSFRPSSSAPKEGRLG